MKHALVNEVGDVEDFVHNDGDPRRGFKIVPYSVSGGRDVRS
jgi:hypothetical protein